MEAKGNLPHARYRRFEGMREYEALIDELIPQTQSRIRIFDRSLSRAYNSPVRHELLRQFLLANRLNRLLIVLHDTDRFDRHHPRMLRLLEQFTEAVSIRETLRPAKHAYDPFVIFDASSYLHRFHYEHLRASHGSHDVVGTQQLLDRFNEIWEASSPVLAPTVSGL